MAINRTHLPAGGSERPSPERVMFGHATGQIGMSWKSSGVVRHTLTAICLLIPLAASANPVMLNPSSLIAFYVVAFWAFVVEAGIIALLLTFRGVAPLRVFIAYFIANAGVFFVLFEPLLEGSTNPPVLALEALVVLIDCLIIKRLVTFDYFQGDNYRGIGWRRSLLVSGVGNGLSYFIGCIATQKP